MALAWSSNRNPGTRVVRNHIVSAIEDRTNFVLTASFAMGTRRYQTASTLVRTRPPLCTPVYWTFVGHQVSELY